MVHRIRPYRVPIAPSSNLSTGRQGDGESASGAEQHAFFQEQLEELDKERRAMFGDDNDMERVTNESEDILDIANSQSITQPHPDVTASLAPESDGSQFEADMEDLHAEREALFQFSAEEKQAWGSVGSQQPKTTNFYSCARCWPLERCMSSLSTATSMRDRLTANL